MLKPFDLQKALAGDKVVTRDGRNVKIAGYNEDINSLLGWVGNGAYYWTRDGNSVLDNNCLFMAPTTRKEWVVRFPEYRIIGPYHTKELAEQMIKQINRPDGTIHEITITE